MSADDGYGRDMSIDEHAEIRTLLGSYALGAVSPLEERRVARHIESCTDCAREVRLLEDTASELSYLAGPEKLPEGFVDRVVDDLPERRRRPSPALRAVAGIAAAALIAVGALGAVFVREQQQHDRQVELVATADQRIELAGSGEFPARGALYVSGDEALLLLEDVPDAGTSRSYQLWALAEGDRPESMVVFEGEGRVERILSWDATTDRFAVTVEPKGGSEQPTTAPVILSA